MAAAKGELPNFVKNDINEFLEENRMEGSSYHNLTPNELLEYYLQWNGIIGFTEKIKKAIEGIYGVKLEG